MVRLKYLCQEDMERNILIINSTYRPIPSRQSMTRLKGNNKNLNMAEILSTQIGSKKWTNLLNLQFEPGIHQYP